MTSTPTAQPIDERLGQLLDVERRLEASLREAEREAAASVEAARARAGHQAQAQSAALEDLARAEEEVELTAHRAVLEELRVAAQARCRALAAVDGARVEQLAHEALLFAIDGAGKVRP